MTEKIETMSKETLELHFMNISTEFKELKDMFNKMDDHIQTQYKKVIVLEENVKYVKLDIVNHKKNVRWGITLIMPTITVGLLYLANFFTPK